MVFHKACRQSPVAISGFNGSFTQENFVVPVENTPGDIFRVLIMNGVTLVTDKTFPVVTIGYTLVGFASALRAMVQYSSSDLLMSYQYFTAVHRFLAMRVHRACCRIRGDQF